MSKSKSKAAAQLVHSQEINHFRENFRKVFLALQKSSEDNKHLIRKCRLLGRQLAETGTKLYHLLEIKQKDEGLVQNLRFKLKEAWMTSETYRSRENAANQLVKQMKGELDKLKAEVNRLHLDNKELKMQLSQQSSTAFFASKGTGQSWGAVSRPKTSTGVASGRTLDRRASTGGQDSQQSRQRNALSLTAPASRGRQSISLIRKTAAAVTAPPPAAKTTRLTPLQSAQASTRKSALRRRAQAVGRDSW